MSDNKKEKVIKNLESLLSNKGCYNKRKDITDFMKFETKIDDAVKNAKKLDINTEQRWLNSEGSRVYLIIEKIKEYL